MFINSEFGEDILMTSKEQRFLILAMLENREIFRYATGAKTYDRLKFDGLRKIDDTIKNRIATLQFYFPCEYHTLNSELLDIFDATLQRELGYKEKMIRQGDRFSFDGFISEWVDWMDNGAKLPPVIQREHLYDSMNKGSKWIQTFQNIIKCFDKSDERLYQSLAPLWAEILTPLYKDAIYNDFGLIVSMGDSSFVNNRYPIISASLITNDFSHTYQQESRRLGWCFDLNPHKVIGMSPEDTTSCVIGRPLPRYLDVAEINLASKSFISLEKSAVINESDCLRFLSPHALTHHTPTMYDTSTSSTIRGPYKGCNEIVFEGSHKPLGIFVIDIENEYAESNSADYPYTDSYLKRARVLAEAFRLPLVIYQKKTNNIRVIQEETYLKHPLRF